MIQCKRFLAVDENYNLFSSDSEEVANNVAQFYIVYDLQAGKRIDVVEDEPDTIKSMDELE